MDRPRGKDDPGVKIEPPAIRMYPIPAGTADVFARTLAAAPGQTVPYVRQYLRLWLGPRPNREPAPESLTRMPLSIHE